MSKYTKKPSAQDFLEWAKNNPDDFEEFYEDELWPMMEDLEADDYFGTEGFDKRFS